MHYSCLLPTKLYWNTETKSVLEIYFLSFKVISKSQKAWLISQSQACVTFNFWMTHSRLSSDFMARKSTKLWVINSSNVFNQTDYKWTSNSLKKCWIDGWLDLRLTMMPLSNSWSSNDLANFNLSMCQWKAIHQFL